MRRQQALINRILRWLADQPDPWADERVLVDALDGDDDTERARAIVQYHLRLCSQAGYIIGQDAGSVDASIQQWQLTWSGHELVDRATASQSVVDQFSGKR